MSNEKNFYIDFVLEGTLRVPESDKDKILKELNKLFNGVLSKRDSIRMNSNITTISEEDMIFPLHLMGPNDFQ